MKFDFTKILDLYNNLNDQTRYAVLGGLVFTIILLDVFFLALPQWGSIHDVNQQISILAQETQQVLVDRLRVNELKKKVDVERDKLDEVSRKVRPIQEVPTILETISSVANDYDVKIDQLVPDKMHQEALKTYSDGSKYFALPVMIKVRCGYHMFGRFLNKLEQQDMFFTIKEFLIQNGAKDVNNHLFSMTIKIILVDRGAAKS